jgi:formate transporter
MGGVLTACNGVCAVGVGSSFRGGPPVFLPSSSPPPPLLLPSSSPPPPILCLSLSLASCRLCLCLPTIRFQLVLSILAGGFITFGATLSLVLSSGVETTVDGKVLGQGLSQLLAGVGFSSGFSLVILSGAALFTEVNVALPLLVLTDTPLWNRCRACLRFWVVCIAGNLIGAFLVAGMMHTGHVIKEGDVAHDMLTKVVLKKLNLGWGRALVSAMLGNWLVGMAAWQAAQAQSITGKYVGILIPVITFGKSSSS